MPMPADRDGAAVDSECAQWCGNRCNRLCMVQIACAECQCKHPWWQGLSADLQLGSARFGDPTGREASGQAGPPMAAAYSLQPCEHTAPPCCSPTPAAAASQSAPRDSARLWGEARVCKPCRGGGGGGDGAAALLTVCSPVHCSILCSTCQASLLTSRVRHHAGAGGHGAQEEPQHPGAAGKLGESQGVAGTRGRACQCRLQAGTCVQARHSRGNQLPHGCYCLRPKIRVALGEDQLWRRAAGSGADRATRCGARISQLLALHFMPATVCYM